MGYDCQLTQKGLNQFIENNKEQIDKIIFNVFEFVVYLKDNTIISGIYPDMNSRGIRLDQLILFGNNDEWFTETSKMALVQDICCKTHMYISNMPEEFQILKYEDM